ncbi:hypothetical protein ACLOJK_015293 [Asimina triloba]
MALIWFQILPQVWDVLSNDEVVEIVSSSPSRSVAARVLVDSAVREWKLKYPTSKIDDCAVVCLYLDGKMDSESEPEEMSISTAHHSQANESDDGQNLEPCLQRNFTVRSSEDSDPCGRIPKAAEVDAVMAVTDDQNWSGLEGVTRVNSLVQLPRFSEEITKGKVDFVGQPIRMEQEERKEPKEKGKDWEAVVF